MGAYSRLEALVGKYSLTTIHRFVSPAYHALNQLDTFEYPRSSGLTHLASDATLRTPSL